MPSSDVWQPFVPEFAAPLFRLLQKFCFVFLPLRITLLITAVVDLPLLNPARCEAIREEGNRQTSDAVRPNDLFN